MKAAALANIEGDSSLMQGQVLSIVPEGVVVLDKEKSGYANLRDL
jgi:hypothetical protein